MLVAVLIPLLRLRRGLAHAALLGAAMMLVLFVRLQFAYDGIASQLFFSVTGGAMTFVLAWWLLPSVADTAMESGDSAASRALNARYWRLLLVFFAAGGPLGGLCALVMARVMDGGLGSGWREGMQIIGVMMMFGWLFGVLPAVCTASLAVAMDLRRNVAGVYTLVLAGGCFSLLVAFALSIDPWLSDAALPLWFMGTGAAASLLLSLLLLPPANWPPAAYGLAGARGRLLLGWAMFVGVPVLAGLVAAVHGFVTPGAFVSEVTGRFSPRLALGYLSVAGFWLAIVMFVVVLGWIRMMPEGEDASLV